MERKFKIERDEKATFIEDLPLQNRKYRAKRKDSDSGRILTIRGLYNFSRTSGIVCDFADNIESDLEKYVKSMKR